MLTFERVQTQAERELFAHLIRWGSEGRPIVKIGRRWGWEFRGLSSPQFYKTKRECVEAWERYEKVLWYAHGYEVQTTGRYREWYEAAS